MAYGFDIPSPQPKNASPSLGQAPNPEETFGDIFGKSSPTLNAGNSAPEPMPQEPSPAMPAGSETQGAMSPAPSPSIPGRPYSNPAFAQAEGQRDQADQTSLLAEQAAKLPKAEREAHEEVVSNDEIEKAYQQAQDVLGANPPSASEFSDQPETSAQALQRFRDNPMQFIKDNYEAKIAKFRAGLGDTTGQKVRGFTGVWDDPKTGRRAAWRDGKFYIRYPKSNGYVPFGESKFDFLGDYILDHVGTLINGGAAIGTQITADAAGAGATALTGNPALGLAIGAAGVPLSGAAGTYAQRGAQVAMDKMYGNEQLTKEESDQVNADALGAALGNVAAAGLIKGSGKVIGSLVNLAKQPGQLTKIYRLNEIKNWYSGFMDTYGSDGVTSGPRLPKGANALGHSIYGAVDAAVDKMSTDIANVEQRALTLAGKDQKFTTANTLGALESVLSDYGINMEKAKATGKVELPDVVPMKTVGHLQGIKAELAEAGDDTGAVSELLGQAKGTAAQESGKVGAAFGTFNGRSELQKVAQHWEMLNSADKMGGMDLKTIFNYLDSFRQDAKLGVKMDAPQEVVKLNRMLQNASMQDRAAAMETIFKGTGLPEEQIFNKVYQNYHDNIDSHRQLMDIFNSQKSAENFIKNTGSSTDTVALMHQVLGEGSEHWQRYKGEILGKMVSDSTNINNGIFDSTKFLKTIGGLDPGTKALLFKPGELKDLMNVARVAEKIPYNDLLSGKDKDAISYIGGALQKSFPVTRMRMIFNLFGKNLEAMDYLTNDVLTTKAAQATTSSEKAPFLNAQRYLQEMMNNMKVVEISRADPKTGVKKMVKMLVPAARTNLLRQGVGAAIQSSTDEAPSTGTILWRSPQPQPGA